MIDFSIKNLREDPERLMLILAVVVLLVAPASLFDQIVARASDPIVQLLVGLFFSGTFLVRGAGAVAGGIAESGHPGAVLAPIPDRPHPENIDPSGAGKF